MEEVRVKLSKKDLNRNAQLFKFTPAIEKIRYEVAYKNLIRDIRKSYTTSFNDATNYSRKKAYQSDSYIQCVKAYADKIISKEQIERCGLEYEEFIFYLGSLIYPKEMIKIYKDN